VGGGVSGMDSGRVGGMASSRVGGMAGGGVAGMADGGVGSREVVRSAFGRLGMGSCG
jgi:hypothetical protein